MTISYAIAAMLVLVVLRHVYESGCCVMCGGRLAHRADCPQRK